MTLSPSLRAGLLAAMAYGTALAQPTTQSTTAVDAYAVAAGLLKADGPSNSNTYDSPIDWPPYPAEWVAMEKTAYAENAPARAVVRRAAVLPAGRWPALRPEVRQPPPAAITLNACRAIANDLADAACYAQTVGRQNEALDFLDDLDRLAADLRGEPGPPGGAIRLMVSVGIDAMRANRLLTIAPLLDISPAAIDPVDPKRVQALIGTLLRQSPGPYQWFEVGEVRRAAARADWAGPQSSERGIGAIDRINAEKTFAAVSLACQLFKAEQGRWPASVEEFVPLYLPAMPTDPWAVPPVPFGYVLEKGGLPDGTDRPMAFHREDSADGMKHTAARPLYAWYRGDGNENNPSGPGTQHGQYRDIAAWPTK